jgi:hypothetical protein
MENYKYNSEGILIDKTTGKQVSLQIIESNEKLKKLIEKHTLELIEKRLIKNLNMKKVFIPISKNDEENKTFIFITKDFLENDKLLILIPTKGRAR